MEPSIAFLLVGLKKLADATGLSDALKDQRKKIAGKALEKSLPQPLKKALDNFLNNADAAPLLEKSFSALAIKNKSARRQLLLKMLTHPEIVRVTEACEAGRPPAPQALAGLLQPLLPSTAPATDAQKMAEIFYGEFAKNEKLIQRLQLNHYFLTKEIHDTTRRIEGKIDRLVPGQMRPILSLPEAPPKFVGREKDLQQLHARLVSQPGLTPLVGSKSAGVFGLGGVGKSTLALQFAHQCLAQNCFPGGILFQPCSGNSLESITVEMCEKAGIEVANLPFDKMLLRLKNTLAPRRLLLILDDVQQDEIEQLQPGGRVSTLVTSRRRDLPFLAESEPIDVEEFTDAECTALFREFLGDAVDAHAEAVSAIFTALGRLPIAVAVAAALLKTQRKWNFDKMQRFLSQNSGLGELQHGKHNVDKLLAEALDTLPAGAQKMLCATAACAEEGFAFRLACRVAGDDEDTGLAHLQKLLDSSLLRELDRDEQRYFLHVLLRQSAARLPAFAPMPALHAAIIKDDFRDWEQDWQKLQDFIPEARQAMRWALQQENASIGYWLGYYGYALCKRIGRLQEALQFMQDYETLATALEDRDSLQKSYGNQANIYYAWGRLEEALALHKKEEAICLELGNRSGLAYCYSNLALLFEEKKQTAKARNYAGQALEIFTQLKMPREREAVEKIVARLQLGSTTG